MSTRTAHLDIRGMSCANCSQTIGDTLESLDGVSEANANYATDDATVEYDPEEASLAEIYEAIETAGYSAERASRSIGITDMSCANCAETNESALEDVPGVIDANVNYATDEATVEYNPDDVSLSDLYEAIEGPATRPSATRATRSRRGAPRRGPTGGAAKTAPPDDLRCRSLGPVPALPRRQVPPRWDAHTGNRLRNRLWLARVPARDAGPARAGPPVLRQLLQRAREQPARQHGRADRAGLVDGVRLQPRRPVGTAGR